MMKTFLLSVLFVLSGCSTCDIPYGTYENFGGSESSTVITLDASSYKLMHEYWLPDGYENRLKKSEQGKWRCIGNKVEMNTTDGLAVAEYLEIGDNPLGLKTTAKALAFQPSKHNVLSKELLYFSEAK